MIIEKEAIPGGYCKTIERNGFVWDYAGHFFHFKRDDIKKYLFGEMNAEAIINVQKKTQIFYDGLYIDYPFQKNIHQLPKQEFIDCLVDLYFRQRHHAKNFKEMLLSRLGRSICHKFLFPYNEKVYQCNLEKLDVNAMGRFFPVANMQSILGNIRMPKNDSYNDYFTYHKSGAVAYVNALMSKIDRSRLCLGEKLESIDLELKVARTNRRTIRFRKLISTIPWNRFLVACRLPHDPALYSYSKVLVFNLGFDRKGTGLNHWVYFPDKDLCFYRVGYYDNILGGDKMSLYVEIGLEPHVLIDEEEMLSRVLNDLKRIGIVASHKLLSYQAVVLDPAYVHLTREANVDYAVKCECLAKNDVYSIGRYGSWRYCSIEDNIIQALEIARQLKSGT